MIVVRVGWRLLVPWCLVCLLTGLLLGLAWGHREVAKQYEARLEEVKNGKAVSDAALSSFAPDKFKARDAKAAVVQRWNRE